MEVVFSLIKENPNSEGLQFFSHTLYSAYPDDTTFFLRNEKSAAEIIKTFDNFSLFSGLKINVFTFLTIKNLNKRKIF